jgi:hypothetical protein
VLFLSFVRFELVLSCLKGGRPSFSLTRGIYLDNPRIVSACMHTLLSVWPHPESDGPSPTKLIAITSNGLTKNSHNALPWLLKIFYSLLTVPHQDKRAVEQFIAYGAAGSQSYECSSEEVTSLTKSGHLFPNWQEELKEGEWQEALIVRPSLLTDGKSACETKGFSAIRAGPEDLPGAWTISRKDVAWFIANKAVKDWDDWKGKAITTTY